MSNFQEIIKLWTEGPHVKAKLFVCNSPILCNLNTLVLLHDTESIVACTGDYTIYRIVIVDGGEYTVASCEIHIRQSYTGK